MTVLWHSFSILILFILAGNIDKHKISNEFNLGSDPTIHWSYLPLSDANFTHRLIMEKLS